jgi:hypothetical protein
LLIAPRVSFVCDGEFVVFATACHVQGVPAAEPFAYAFHDVDGAVPELLVTIERKLECVVELYESCGGGLVHYAVVNAHDGGQHVREFRLRLGEVAA